MAGAEVTVRERETGQARTAVSSEAGTFSFPAIPSGAYDVTVTKDGFQSFTAQSVPVSVDQIARVNAALVVGAVNQSVEVSDAAAVLQTDSGEVRTELSSRAGFTVQAGIPRLAFGFPVVGVCWPPRAIVKTAHLVIGGPGPQSIIPAALAYFDLYSIASLRCFAHASAELCFPCAELDLLTE